MSDDIDTQDESMERGDEPLPAKPQPTGWEWWPAHHDEIVKQRLVDAANMKMLNAALDKLFPK